MFERLAIPAINRLLADNAWARERLRAHAGKTVRFSSPPVELNAVVLDSGDLAAAPRDRAPDVIIVATPGVLLRLAAGDEHAWQAATVSGDVALAQTVDYLRRHVEWDYEEDLSRFVGDIAAHRIGGALRGARRWGRSTLLNLSESFADYAAYEGGALASKPALEAFNRDVDYVRDHAARLEKRLELLQRELESVAGDSSLAGDR